MGLGAFGGGLGAVKFLLDHGARVTLTDLRSEVQLRDSLSAFDPGRLEQLVLGTHRPQDFLETELVVVNPAVSPGNRFVQAAREAGVPLTSEINLFWELCPARKVVVTGSVGKSTTAALITHLLRGLGCTVRLGGNIGHSLLPEVDQISGHEWVVLELSSFQLADLDRLRPRAEVAVVTNLHPNHLDWHGTLAHYRAAKQAAVRWQSEHNFTVLNHDDPDVSGWPGAGRRMWFGSSTPSADRSVTIQQDQVTARWETMEYTLQVSALAAGLQLPHMRLNVAAALGAVLAAMLVQNETSPASPPLQFSSVESACATFQMLPHRMQAVGEWNGRQFINDSKATTPEAAIAALSALSQPVWLIAGGKDKGVDLGPFSQVAAARAQGVALIGGTASQLAAALRSYGCRKVELSGTLESAVGWCRRNSNPGDVILLSPACASDGEFANYEQRGDTFAQLAVASDPARD